MRDSYEEDPVLGQVPHRLSAARLIAVGGTYEAWAEVPSAARRWVRGQAIRVKCPCGAVTTVQMGGCEACAGEACDRVFWHTGSGLRVARQS